MALLLVPSPMRSVARKSKKKIFGVVFVVVILGLLYLTVAIYNKALPFQSRVPVTLKAAAAGNELTVPADVKLRGILVGEVTKLTTTAQTATLQLELDPDQVRLIPANVKAMILPKTLFGEKFVDLEYPSNPSDQHIKAGAVIPEDRSQTAIETGRVFNDLLPLLQTLDPPKLAQTLNALGTALAGRGDELGNNFALADSYFKQFNPSLPNLDKDLAGLADVANSYADNAPELLRIAHNFAVNSRDVVVAKQDALAQFLVGTAGFADTTTDLLNRNANDLIRLPQVSQPTLNLLADYSSEFPCFFHGLAALEPRLDRVFGGEGPYLHITLEVVKQPQAYKYPGDYPRGYTDTTGPNCITVPNGPVGTVPNAPQSGTGPSAPGLPSLGLPSLGATAPTGIGAVGSGSEKQLINQLVAPSLQTSPDQVPDVADLLLGPMMRGTQVSPG